MTKWKAKRKVVGAKDCKLTLVSTPMISLIVTHQKKLQEKEDNKKVGKKRKISFVYASLSLSRRIKK